MNVKREVLITQVAILFVAIALAVKGEQIEFAIRFSKKVSVVEATIN